ncbi:MAG: phage portal protein [Candidatus Bipolaricaulota bacterium]|nr:phage portal protein [Candidatus Bipolaricaulota bacterium]MDW8127473.1 phage portal protein [Candidatus Bipolaricaulota bacterium]
MPDDQVFLLGNTKFAKSVPEILAALQVKQTNEEPRSQSEELFAQGEEGRFSYIPFPYGLDPNMVAELFHADPTHHACCVLKARALLANEWRLERIDGVPDQPPPELIRRVQEVFPDGLDAVIYPAALDYEALGNAYLEIIRYPDARTKNGLGAVARVTHVPAFSVRRLPPDHPTGCAYVQLYRGQEVYFREYGQLFPVTLPEQGPVTELIHIKNIGGQSAANYWYGIPDILSALYALFGLRKAMDFLTGHLAAKGVPNYLLILEGAGSSPDQIDFPLINRYFNEALNQGPGKIVVLPTPPSVQADLQTLTLGFEPRETIAFINECRDQIARAHGVPLRLISVLEAGQLGSTGEAQVQLEFFKRYVVRPRQAMWENLITNLLFGDSSSIWRVRFGEITLEDISRLIQANTTAVRFGVMTPNEARVRQGLKPLPEGEELVILAGGEPILLRDIFGMTEAPEEEPEKGSRLGRILPAMRRIFSRRKASSREKGSPQS